MKKLLNILLISMMTVALCGCGQKKTIKVTVVDDNENNFVYSGEVKADYLVEALYEMGKTLGFIFEMEEDQITVINGIKAEGDAYWKLLTKDKESSNTVAEEKIHDGDEFSFIYTKPEEKEVVVDEKPQEPEKEPDDEPVIENNITGAWELNTSYTALLENDDQEIFEKALEGLVGVSYQPIRVLATQLVQGLRYAYLAQGETVTLQPSVDYYIVVIYKDTDGLFDITIYPVMKLWGFTDQNYRVPDDDEMSAALLL